MRAPRKNGGRPAGRGRPWPRGIVIGTGLALLAGVLAVAAPAAAGTSQHGSSSLSAGAAKPTQYLTQSLAGLTIRARPSTIRNTRAVRVTFVVTDAGDPVKGAKVKVNGHTLITGKNGACSLTFRKHARPGAYRATAALASYYGASVTVHVKS